MIELRALDESDFSDYLESVLTSYSKEKARAERVETSTALEETRRVFTKLLPAGAQTPGHLFFWLADANRSQRVGTAWLLIEESNRSAYLCDIVIFPEYRGRGMGSEALVRLEELARSRGCQELRLHVFAHNEGAMRLYARSGFATTSMYMHKALAGSARAL